MPSTHLAAFLVLVSPHTNMVLCFELQPVKTEAAFHYSGQPENSTTTALVMLTDNKQFVSLGEASSYHACAIATEQGEAAVGPLRTLSRYWNCSAIVQPDMHALTCSLTYVPSLRCFCPAGNRSLPLPPTLPSQREAPIPPPAPSAAPSPAPALAPEDPGASGSSSASAPVGAIAGGAAAGAGEACAGCLSAAHGQLVE